MDLRKLRDKASEAFTKGKFARAAELYAEYCEKDPRDIQARLRMGDAWAKAGDRQQAIVSYKAAALAFAKEGFLPRAIAASKLILELDPSHTGVQQMLADLYARKSGGSAPARKPPAPAAPAPSKHAPIELPEDESAPAAPSGAAAPASSKYAPIGLPDEPPPPPPETIDVDADAGRGGLPGAGELPPELEIVTEPPKAPEVVLEISSDEVDDGEEIEIEAPAANAVVIEIETSAPAASSAAAAPDAGATAQAGATSTDTAPPGLRRRTTQTETPLAAIAAASAKEDRAASAAASGLDASASVSKRASSTSDLRPASTAAAQPVARNELAAPASRIFIPGAPADSSAPVPLPAPGSSFTANTVARPTASDLERALSKFDELSLEDAPSAPLTADTDAAAPSEQAPKLPSFTELELEGDSLLHAVEVAALAGKSQRGEETTDTEEEVFSLTAEVGEGQKSADELPKIPLFSDLPPDAFIELFDRCPLRRYGMDERIIAQGSVGDAFYVVCEGAVRVVREDADGASKELAQLGDGAFFGEMALLSGAPRSASVDSASEDTQLLEISAPVLAQLSLRYPSVAAALKKFCRQRMLQNVMNQSALFRPFQKSERRALVERFRARDVNKGAVILREAQPTDGLYIVLSGEVEVAVQGQVVARLHEGEVFGEMSLLKKSPATATVSATRRTSLIRLPRADFDALILSHPQILILVSELTDDRQRQNEAVLSGSAEVGEQGLLLV